MTRVADIIAQRLKARGVRYAFGIPGGEVLTLVDALGAAGIEFITARHEGAAGMMAQGTYFATGAPGVMVATLGPGAANCVNPCVNALQERIPMIALVGRVDAADAATYTHQLFDHAAVLRPVVKAALEALPGAAAAITDKALAIATDMRPGPVLLELGVEAALARDDARFDAARVPTSALAPTAEVLAAITSALAGAERPLVIAGTDALRDGSAADIARFCKQTGIPLLTTYGAKGVLDETHPLCLGGAGLSPKADALLLPFVRSRDALVLAGYDPIEMRRPWRDPFGADAFVLEIASAAPTHGMHRANVTLLAHVGATLAGLGAGIAHPADAEVAGLRAALADAFAPSERWGPTQICAALSRSIPRDVRVTVDTGAHRILISQVWRAAAPLTMLQSTAFCTMGVALPHAIGVALAERGKPVVAVMGDGGLEMVLGELATLRDHALPVVVVVFADESLALIDLKQRAMGYEARGCALGPTDYAATARAMGIEGTTARSMSELESAMKAALASAAPALISCPFPRQEWAGVI